MAGSRFDRPLALALTLIAAVSFEANARPTRCPAGRYLVGDGPAPFTADGARAAIVIDAAGRLSLTGCEMVTASQQVRRRATRLVARWAGCGSFRKVSLKARIASPACDRLVGKLRARGRAVQVVAQRGKCGDGIVDREAGEQCERGVGGDGQGCDGTCGLPSDPDPCRCRPPATTTTSTQAVTTTTIEPSSSTTTTAATTSSTSGTTSSLVSSTTTGSAPPTTTLPPPCSPAFAECENFVVRTGPNQDRTVTFGQTQAYLPKCLRIRVGQQVHFVGAFADHPLRSACGGTIPRVTSGTGRVVTFNAAGRYGYYCANHGFDTGGGMAGSIDVIP